MVSKSIWAKVLERDVCCWHCGRTDDTLVPQHRINRGMGGSKLLDTPSNLVALCSESNVLMESNSDFREKSLMFGWKLQRHQKPDEQPIYDFMKGDWFLIDNDWNKIKYQQFLA